MQKETKRCTKCGLEKPRTDFRSVRSRKGKAEYLYPKCKPCEREYMREYLRSYEKRDDRRAWRREYERGWNKTAKGLEKRQRMYVRHHDKILARRKRHWVAVWEKIRAIYGSLCACCGEAELSFLTVEHINNDGAADRRKHGGNSQLRNWLAKQPKQPGYEILCWNCQWGRRINGGICPHELKKQE